MNPPAARDRGARGGTVASCGTSIQNNRLQHLARHATPMMTARYHAQHEPEVLARLLDGSDSSVPTADSSTA